jgi:hypothetical protein
MGVRRTGLYHPRIPSTAYSVALILRAFPSTGLHMSLAQARAKRDIEGDIVGAERERIMARHLLTTRRVTALVNDGRPCRYADGGCLYCIDRKQQAAAARVCRL